MFEKPADERTVERIIFVRKIESIADIQFDTTIDNTFFQTCFGSRDLFGGSVDSRNFQMWKTFEKDFGLSAAASTHFDDCILFPEIDFFVNALFEKSRLLIQAVLFVLREAVQISRSDARFLFHLKGPKIKIHADRPPLQR